MVKGRTKGKSVSIKVDSSTYKTLKNERKETGVPIATLIKFAVQNYIKK